MATYTGTVTSFNFGKNGDAGYGFITCDQVDGNVYFQRKELPEELKNFGYNNILKGKTVSFQLTHTPDGKPQGKNVQLVPQDGERLGKIRSYSRKNLYGFITSPHTHEDCYFQQKELPPSVQSVDGQRLVGSVQFEVLLKPNGKPWATNVKLHKMIMAAGQMPPAQVFTRFSKSGKNCPCQKANPSMCGMPFGHFGNQVPGTAPALGRKRVSPIASAPTPEANQTRVMAQQAMKFGTVLSFKGAKGFGFIAGDSVSQGDIFFSRDSLVPGTPHKLTGCRVKFELTINPGTNKPQANKVSLVHIQRWQ